MMKLPSRKAMLGAVFLAIVLKAGPDGLHLLHRVLTPEEAFAENQETFEELVISAGTLEPEQRAGNLDHRRYLTLWFRARGLEIDDVSGPPRSTWQAWADLFDYWTFPLE